MSDRLKSVFIGLYPVLVMAVVLKSLLALNANPMQLVWWGALATSAPMMALFMRLMILKDLARTSKSLPVLSSLALVGFALALYAWSERGEPQTGFVFAAAGFAGFMLYNFWYSNYGRTPSDLITVGQPLPEFTVQEADGAQVPSASFTGQPALILFYRGNWCPLCMAQIDELAALHRDFEDLGIQIILISPQPPRFSAKLAKRHSLNFRFLADRDGAAARDLKLLVRNGLPLGLGLLGYATDTVYPTVIMTDAGGRVIFADQTDNYRVRPEPDTYLRIYRETLAG
ncbi:MAG: redoxin domain-containing protein [Proteobacteria bacterium]|nr:redoxin domain-containing protein [Pseudomonadota bacterium]